MLKFFIFKYIMMFIGILTLIVLGDRMSQSVGVGLIVPAGFVTIFNMVLL